MSETQDVTFAPGTKLREYETNMVFKPDLSDDAVTKTIEKYRALIAREGGKAVKFSTWMRKKLSYTVKHGGQKLNRGIYIHVHYLGPAKLPLEVERNLKMNEDMIRFLTVKLADQVDANRPVEADVKHTTDTDIEKPIREDRRNEEPEFEGEGEFEAD